MKFSFAPDYYFNTFDEVTPEFLKSHGIEGILLDVDNTLEPYENPKPTEKVVKWFASLSENGIRAALVSNNNQERIDEFNKELGLVAYSKVSKPSKKYLVKAMQDIGTKKENTIMMGDQVFTDVWAAHNAGIPGILVPPIRDKKNLLTRFKRFLEKPILHRYFKKISEREKK